MPNQRRKRGLELAWNIYFTLSGCTGIKVVQFSSRESMNEADLREDEKS